MLPLAAQQFKTVVKYDKFLDKTQIVTTTQIPLELPLGTATPYTYDYLKPVMRTVAYCPGNKPVCTAPLFVTIEVELFTMRWTFNEGALILFITDGKRRFFQPPEWDGNVIAHDQLAETLTSPIPASNQLLPRSALIALLSL